MPSYLSLINWTDQGVRTINDGAQRLEAVKQAAQDAGGRLIFFYMLMGQYDAAVLVDLPNDEAAARLFLITSSQGNVRTTTLKAFTEDEYKNILASLP